MNKFHRPLPRMCRHLIKFILKVMKREFCIVWTETTFFPFVNAKHENCLDVEVKNRERITGNESEARSRRIHEENSDSDSGQRKIELSNLVLL
jgi:hypothetical protein